MQVNELYGNEPITIESYLKKCGVRDTKEYLSPTGKYIDEWWKYLDIPYACKEIEYWSKLDSTVFIIQDGDGDGICSTVILYQYLMKLSDKWTIKIIIHSGKQRGLDDEDIMNRIRQERPELVIIPDAGTNNCEQADELCALGIGLIVLDHHDMVTPIDKGYLINNQDTRYDVSRNGSGALVTHKFLQGLDNQFGLDWSRYFIDLVALSLISDSMIMSEMENREYYHFGLETRDCVHNEFLSAMIDRFIGNDYTQRDIAFKIVPKLNAVCRCDNIELKQQLILAFIGQSDIDEVLDMVEQAHQNQIKIVDDVIQNNMDTILSRGQNNLIVFASDDVPRSYSGLLAGKIKTLCDNKPTIVGSIKDDIMIGSLRSPISLREELDNNELVDWCSGHEDSAGIQIQVDNIQALVDYYNTLELSYTPHIDVLKSYSIKSIPTRLFGLFEPYNALWNNSGLPKPKFYIKNITFTPSDWSIMGKNKRTLKLHKDGIDIMIFNCLKKDKEDLQLEYYENDIFVNEPSNSKLQMDCVGELSINEWNGQKKWQIVVDKIEIRCYNKPCKDDLF